MNYSESARSARKHKAWGVSPRESRATEAKPAERATAQGTDASGALQMAKEKRGRGVRNAVARSAGCNNS